ncbi:2-keto-4-pentenoate hydratase [Paracoccus laeviglucosivorans]|uniref:2-keto-4-pentenoate hydratase n=1 Tax=Paracoccus laeviglucosivorans TaxID=1197861 RepID=A0A521FRR6_9RHOB|nr:fumarylacetoacetate hydrolase family protein [Paracoccus laeviglucosivorans]SMO98927.1 2-keto-4-pentenoate hydratase [Paracoccus laeviglucosivorans]
MTRLVAAERAAELLLRSRLDGAPLAELPQDLAPASLAEAYAVQDATLRQIGPAGGWKVAAKPDGEPRCAVLPASAFHASGVTLKVPPAGFEAEVETAFVFATGLPARTRPYQRDEVAAAIGSMHLAVELISSRFIDRKSIPPLSPIADLQGNAAVILGPAIAGWRDIDLAALALTMRLGDARIEWPLKNLGLPQTLEVLTWLANHALTRGGGLARGDVVITGARLGPAPLGDADSLSAECPQMGKVTANFSR